MLNFTTKSILSFFVEKNQFIFKKTLFALSTNFPTKSGFSVKAVCVYLKERSTLFAFDLCLQQYTSVITSATRWRNKRPIYFKWSMSFLTAVFSWLWPLFIFYSYANVFSNKVSISRRYSPRQKISAKSLTLTSQVLRYHWYCWVKLCVFIDTTEFFMTPRSQTNVLSSPLIPLKG